jgi:hypothetical protein
MTSEISLYSFLFLGAFATKSYKIALFAMSIRFYSIYVYPHTTPREPLNGFS